MAKLNLGLQTTTYERTERDEYGTIRTLVKEYMSETKSKKANCRPVSARNFTNKDKQILLAIFDEEGNHNPSKVIHVSKELSDEIRAGLTTFGTIADFPVIHHVHNTPAEDGSYPEYPLVVRPTQELDIPEGFDNFAITADTKTVEYKRELPSISAILKNMQV